MNNLEKVLVIPTDSHNEEYMRQFLIKEINNIPNTKINISEYGIQVYKNIKKLSPMFCCHIDTVHDIPTKYKIQKHILNDNIYYTSDYGIGGDDKCGVYICLELLKNLDSVQVCFLSREEIGCVGSYNIDINTDNISMFISIDRKGNRDLITEYIYSRLSSECLNEVLNITNQYEYKQTSGLITDSFILQQRYNISAINLSCGYYNPHTLDEYVNYNDIMYCLDMCYALNNINEQYPYKIKDIIEYDDDDYSYWRNFK